MKLLQALALSLLVSGTTFAQSAPIYQITVTERTVKAVNYQYRNGPTRLDFRGTVLMPDAKGEATVESKSGRTDIQAKVDHLAAPTRFGREYLTYVLWAITPEGHAKNLGEIVPNGSDHASFQVTSDLQAFGMIVTAEPYSAVRQPSDVVVMENEVRPDTIGKVEVIQAKYELLPRGQYTYVKDAVRPPDGRKVSMAEYESLTELYQAQNAVQIAASQDAAKYAPDTFAKAESLLREARDLNTRKAGRSLVVATAREAAQTAEDARMIATQRKHDAELASAKQAARDAEDRRLAAEQEARRARIEASEERGRAQEQQSADRMMTAPAAPTPAPAYVTPPPPPPAPAPAPKSAIRRPDDGAKKQLRATLFHQLNMVLPTTDTPRGLTIILPESDFRGGDLDGATAARVARVAAVLANEPGIAIRVEGYTDSPASRANDLCYRRAISVRTVLGRGGLAPETMSVDAAGMARPIASNSTAGGRAQNRRVEITISGDAIGSVPTWDRTYSLK